MLAKYDERCAVRQGRPERHDGFNDPMDSLNPTSNDISLTTLKNYPTEMRSHLMSIKAVPDCCPSVTSGLSKELSMQDV
jgi:hypothetical protein